MIRHANMPYINTCIFHWPHFNIVKLGFTWFLRKEEVAEKTYVLELESELNQLRSTVELYKRVAESKINKVTHSESHINATTGTNDNQTCIHRCCAKHSEKIQENSIRQLETQMQQNLYINNSMHIQLVAQMQQFQATLQQKFNEHQHTTNHTYPQRNQVNWYGMSKAGHTPYPPTLPHVPPPTYGQTVYQQSQNPLYTGYLPQNMVRVPFHTSQHATAGATPWQQSIPLSYLTVEYNNNPFSLPVI